MWVKTVAWINRKWREREPDWREPIHRTDQIWWLIGYMACRRGRNRGWPLGFLVWALGRWWSISWNGDIHGQRSRSSGPAMLLEPCRVQAVIALGAAWWPCLSSSLIEFTPGRKDMKQLSEKTDVLSDDLITILVSTETGKKNALWSECMWERALTSLSDKISSRMWLLRKIVKDKLKRLARD